MPEKQIHLQETTTGIPRKMTTGVETKMAASKMAAMEAATPTGLVLEMEVETAVATAAPMGAKAAGSRQERTTDGGR